MGQGNLDFGIRNQYPSAPGGTTSQYASAASRYANQGVTQTTPIGATPEAGDGNKLAQAASVGKQGNPVVWFIVLLGMLLALMYGTHKLGGGDDNFKQIRLSAYNVLVISFAAIIGISFWKTVFTKFPVPGVTTIVLGT